MTDREARIARIAFKLGATHVRYGPVDVERFIKNFEEQRPCLWAAECIMTGRCPREIVCDN